MDEHPRSRRQVLTAGLVSALAVAGCSERSGRSARPDRSDRAVARASGQGPAFELPPIETSGALTLETVLSRRRSVRRFTGQRLGLAQVGQLMWAAQGVTVEWGGRTAPSAGALYPIEVFAAMPDRVLHYLPDGHRAEVWAEADGRGGLADAAGQEAVDEGAVVFVLAVVPRRTAAKYGSRAARYVDLEVGHAAQNLLLEAVALGLGAVPIGAFDDDRVARQLSLPSGTDPRYLIPVGQPTPA